MFPNNSELTKDDEYGCYNATIIDAELDPVKCYFNYDMSVQLDTSKLSHVCLDINALERLIELILQTEELFENEAI